VDRPPNDPPARVSGSYPDSQPDTRDEHEGACDDSSTVSGGPRTISPIPAVQRSEWQGAEGARNGGQPHPRWPACEATAYRQSPAPAPGANQLRLSSVRDARSVAESRSEPRSRPDEWFSSEAVVSYELPSSGIV